MTGGKIGRRDSVGQLVLVVKPALERAVVLHDDDDYDED